MIQVERSLSAIFLENSVLFKHRCSLSTDSVGWFLGDFINSKRDRSKSGFTPSKCGLTVSIIRGWAVERARANGLSNSCIIITARDRINRSMERRQLRGCSTRQCLSFQNLFDPEFNSVISAPKNNTANVARRGNQIWV